MIEEIPINSENPINSEINAEPVNVEPVEEVAKEDKPAPAPKKRGRPVGAKGKAKAAPKAPAAKPKRKPPAPALVEETESEEEVVVKKRARRVAPPDPEPQVPSTQDVALEVMQLFTNRHQDRASQRRTKYASWFA